MAMLTREYQLRDATVSGDGRTLVLACVPFDREAVVDDGGGPYRELFRRGAFEHLTRAANRTELRYLHGNAPADVLGFASALVETGDFLEGAFRVAPSASGDQVLALVRDRQLSGVSIAYVAGEHDGDNRRADHLSGGLPLVERLRVRKLPHVALVPVGAFEDAGVLAVREPPLVDPLVAARVRERHAWELHKLKMLRYPA